MNDVTTKDLLAKIGALVVENDVLRSRIAQLEAEQAATATADASAAALRPTQEG